MLLNKIIILSLIDLLFKYSIIFLKILERKKVIKFKFLFKLNIKNEKKIQHVKKEKLLLE